MDRSASGALRPSRIARFGVVGSVLATAILCVVGVMYVFRPLAGSWAAGIGLGLVALGIAADLAVRHTWRRTEGGGASRQERLRHAAEVAGVPADWVIRLDWALGVLWIVILVVAVIAVRTS
ncbi:MAG TPA: hypothetical protein VGW38_06810 [Chloroflexota bacterium]|nr:hypothetical protein [Chloroflexota bacterium]